MYVYNFISIHEYLYWFHWVDVLNQLVLLRENPHYLTKFEDLLQIIFMSLCFLSFFHGFCKFAGHGQLSKLMVNFMGDPLHCRALAHSRAPIVHTAVPRENNEHGCVYLRYFTSSCHMMKVLDSVTHLHLMMPVGCQVIVWASAGWFLNCPMGTNFSRFLIKIHQFSKKKMNLKMSLAKWWTFYAPLSVLYSNLPSSSMNGTVRPSVRPFSRNTTPVASFRYSW